jgi:GTP-dependent phosphoenolpyruvate carboxykinase
MLPSCGYHIGDYFDDWLNMGRGIRNPPRMELDAEGWLHKLALHQELFAKLDNHLPPEFLLKRESLVDSLPRTPARWTPR